MRSILCIVLGLLSSQIHEIDPVMAVLFFILGLTLLCYSDVKKLSKGRYRSNNGGISIALFNKKTGKIISKS